MTWSPEGQSVVDEQGREVMLTAARWKHITDGHPELKAFRKEVLRAAQAPTRRGPGHRPNEEWCALQAVGPSSWLKVVIVYEEGRGHVVTAFARRSLP